MHSAEDSLVGVVVVNWNGISQTRQCLESVAASRYPKLRVCLVDNGSTDGSPSFLKREFPAVDVVALPSNLGYAAGCNAGIAWAKETGLHFVLLLNNDTILDAEAIGLLVDRAADVRLSGSEAILAPKILYAWSPNTIWSAGGSLRWPWLERDHIGIGEEDCLHETPKEVKWASGCALFLSLEVARTVGPFDERYFLYLEDVDWCLRARRKGVRVWFVPEARLWHNVSQSAREIDSRAMRYYHARNYYMLVNTHCGPVGRAWAAMRIAVTLLKTAVRSALFPSYRHDSYYQSQTRAIVDFLRGRRGPAPYSTEAVVSPRATANERLA